MDSQIATSEDEAGREILRYILLHRARSHQFDLQVELRKLRGPDGAVRVSAADLRSLPRFRYDVLIQVAVEFQLRDERLMRLWEEDPSLLRFAYDALYYFSRQWRAGEAVNLNPANFSAYLKERGNSGEKLPDAKNENANGADQPSDPGVVTDAGNASSQTSAAGMEGVSGSGAPAQGAPSGNGGTVAQDLPLKLPLTSAEELEFYRLAAAIQVSLADPDAFVQRVEEQRKGQFSENVLDAIRGLPPLLKRVGTRSEWTYEYKEGSGKADDSSAFLEGDELPSSRSVARRFAAHIAELDMDGVTAETLAEEFHVLPRTPAWSAVQASFARIDDAQWTGVLPSSISDDITIVRAYVALIRENLWAILHAVFSAWVLGARATDYATADAERGAVRRGLILLDSQLGLWRQSPRDTRELLREVAAGLMLSIEPLQALRPTLIDSPPKEINGWGKALDDVVKLLRGQRDWRDDLGALTPGADAWAAWERRLSRQIPWRPDYRPETVELIAAAGHVGPSRIFSTGPKEANLLEWSAAAAAALKGTDAGGDSVPVWILVPALLELGFGSSLDAILSTFADSPPAPSSIVLPPGSPQGSRDTDVAKARNWLERIPAAARRSRARRALVLYEPSSEALVAAWKTLLPTDAAILLPITDANVLAGDPLWQFLNFDRWAWATRPGAVDLPAVLTAAQPNPPDLAKPLAERLAKLPSTIALTEAPDSSITIRRSDVAVTPTALAEIFDRASEARAKTPNEAPR